MCIVTATKPIGNSPISAAYAATFFGMSRSSVIRRKSALSLAFSAETPRMSACRGLGSLYFFNRAYRLCAVLCCAVLCCAVVCCGVLWCGVLWCGAASHCNFRD